MTPLEECPSATSSAAKPGWSTPAKATLCLVLIVAAGLSWPVYRLVSNNLRSARLRATLPKVCEALCEQRNRLTSAIAAYHQAFGTYPPDHVVSRNPIVVDSVTNQLFYELVGCVYNSTNHSYSVKASPVRLPVALLKEFFNTETFRNSAEQADQLKPFLPSASTETLIAIHEKPETIALLSFWPTWEGFDFEFLGDLNIRSWQYNSSSPVHNQSSYDLWFEIGAPGTNIVIGNW